MLSQRTAEEEAMLDGFITKPLTASMLWDAAVNTETPDTRVRKSSRTGRGQRRLSGMKLLVVEDNLINQQVAEELLNSEGARVSLAANGQLGVEAVASANPQFDAVLMDIQMPVLDGYGATRAIRTKLGEKDLPVIAMTANAMDSDRQAALDAGMNAHVGKPFDLNHLVSVLRGLVPEKPRSEHATDSQPAAIADTPPDAQPLATGVLSEAVLAHAQTQGIDIVPAVERMGENQALYARLAGDFVQTLLHAPAQWDTALRSSDVAQLTRELHTMKGLAATLGVGFLSTAAAHAESLCKAQQDVPTAKAAMEPMDAWVQKAIAALTSVCALLEQETPTAETDPVAAPRALGVAPEAVRETLSHLRGLIGASDMDVLQQFTVHRATLAQVSRPLTTQLDSALSTLDFATARTLCDELGHALENIRQEA
jgi:CheY-like chemotaxis protein